MFQLYILIMIKLFIKELIKSISYTFSYSGCYLVISDYYFNSIQTFDCRTRIIKYIVNYYEHNEICTRRNAPSHSSVKTGSFIERFLYN